MERPIDQSRQSTAASSHVGRTAFFPREADLSLGLRDGFLQYDAETLHQIETVAFALAAFL